MSIDTSTTSGKVLVMEAFLYGRKIECANRGCSDWDPSDCPAWNWDHFDYRIAPEPPKKEWKPWTMETCPVCAVIKKKANGVRVLITGVYGDSVSAGAHMAISYADLLTYWTMGDGTPCGVEVEVSK